MNDGGRLYRACAKDLARAGELVSEGPSCDQMVGTLADYLGVGTAVLEVACAGISGAPGSWREHPVLRWVEIEPEIDADEVREWLKGVAAARSGGGLHQGFVAAMRAAEAWLRDHE